MRFLEHIKVEWARNIKLPTEPNTVPKRISGEDIVSSLSQFKGHPHYKQIKALILLGSSTGIRAEELYQLELEDIKLDSRTVSIIHDESTGKTTKTKHSRISFFNNETRQALSDYLEYFNNQSNLSKLFSQRHILQIFKDAPIQVKDLRKYFSQEWDRRGGPTSIKKILMGHSLKGDVDLMHYNYQSEEDLKKIYDKVMNKQTPLDSVR